MLDPTTDQNSDQNQVTPDPSAQSDGDSTLQEAPSQGSVGELPSNDQADALAAMNDKLLRLAAEYDNFRRRTVKEKAEAADRGAMLVVSRLLDALDDMERLDASDPTTTTAEGFREAFGLVRRKLQQSLETAGLERIAPQEVAFDPTEHDAVSVVPPEFPEQDHLVKMTLQTGYRFKGLVVRPARVQVYSEQGTS